MMSSLSKPTPSTLLTLLTFTGALCHVTLGQACPSNATSPVLDEKVSGSEVVVQGRFRRKVKVDLTSQADVDVECVLKGGPVPALIDVSWPHLADRRCVELGDGLVENAVYLLYLNRPGSKSGGGPRGSYTLTFRPDPAEKKYLDELKYTCGLMMQLPEGGTKSSVCQPEKFVTEYSPEYCEDSSRSTASFVPALPAALVLAYVLLRLLIL